MIVSASVHSNGCACGCAEYWMAHNGVQQAHQLLERMKLTKVPVEPYVEPATIAAVYKVSIPE